MGFRTNMSLVVVEKESEKEDLSFWRQRTPEERLSAVELLREQYYAIQGHKTVPRIIKTLRIIERMK